MSNEEYAIERDFTFVDWLENGDILVKTEYGSLLTEAMLKDVLLTQFAKTCRRLRRHQHLRIRMEVLNLSEDNACDQTPL